MLTDNRLKFTDKFVGEHKTVSANHVFTKLCKAENVDYRLTAPFTPKTNSMVEKVNGTINDSTIKIETYQNVSELITSLNQFLLFYIFTRRNASLPKELGSKLRTPLDAIEAWFKIEPKSFKISPSVFRANAIEKLEQHGVT